MAAENQRSCGLTAESRDDRSPPRSGGMAHSACSTSNGSFAVIQQWLRHENTSFSCCMNVRIGVNMASNFRKQGLR
jgi:hypothetical protein